jgi:hypothetical protein
MTDRAVDIITRMVADFHKLIYLTLDMSKSVSRLKSLTHFQLILSMILTDCSNLTDASVVSVSGILKHLTNLNQLSLSLEHWKCLSENSINILKESILSLNKLTHV